MMSKYARVGLLIAFVFAACGENDVTQDDQGSSGPDSSDTSSGSTVGMLDETGDLDATGGGSTSTGASSSTSGDESSTGASMTCGNGVVEGEEECDDGPANADEASCKLDCTMAFCGDGAVLAGVEVCDDQNNVDGDGCAADCTPEPCGPAGQVIYVDADATGAADGTSWADAYTRVPDAYAVAGLHDEIWVAEGVYAPARANAPVATLQTCVDLYGGFVGTETSVDERPLPLAATLLSGDFLGNDGGGSVADNSFHVVTADAVMYSTVDGVRIVGGHATGGAQDSEGGGLRVVDSEVTLRNVIVQGNSATVQGGGLFASGASILVESSDFIGNAAQTSNATGGGGFVTNSTLMLVGTTFASNTATGIAGGLRVLSASTVVIDDCSFESNSTGVSGGALTTSDSTTTISGSMIIGNISGNDAGGIGTSGELPVDIIDTLVDSNTAADYAGGISFNSPGTATNVTFSNNHAAHGGGGASRNGASYTFIDVQFVGNTVSGVGVESGGGLVILDGTTTIIGALFQGNSSTDFGGAIAVSGNDDFTLQDAQFIGNTSGAGGAVSFGAVATAIVSDVTFSGNVASTCGGGIRIAPGGATSTIALTNATLDSNSTTVAGSDGGGVCAESSADGPVLSIGSTTFIANTAVDDGGGIYTGAPLQLRDVAFLANQAGGDGGGLSARTRPDSPRVASTSFHQNGAGGLGGGIALAVGTAGASGTIRNSVLWGNGTDISGEALTAISYTCSGQALGGVGNQLASSDPFLLGGNDELFLDQASVCVDHGDDAAATADYGALSLDWTMLTTDALGTADATPVDMGVHYEP